MKVKEIAFVAYAVTDVARARKFYEETFGLTPASVYEEGGMAFIEYWIGKGNEHCLVLGAGAPQFKPGTAGATAALEVEDFDAAVSGLKARAVKFGIEPIDAGPCRMALVFDPDGNQILIHKRKADK